MAKSPTRKDKARPNIEILTVIAIVMEQKRPIDWLFMYTLRAWSLLTSLGVRKDHIIAVLCITDRQFEDSLRRLRFRGYVAWDKDTGYMVITERGKAKMYTFQAKRSTIWKRMEDYAAAEITKNFTRNKTQDETTTDDQPTQ